MAEDSVREHNRFDVEIEVVDVDRDSGHIRFHVHPDPGRYDWLERDGERFLYDRFDDVYFPHALVIDMLKQAMNMPHAPGLAVIPNVEAYVASRRPVIAASLRGEAPAEELADIAEAQLREFEKDELAFVILSVDIKGSTRLQTSSNRRTFARTINTVLTELAELVVLFHGHVLKYTGDGLIAYFPEPTFIIKSDAAVDCAYCARRLIYDAVNTELEQAGLPTIEVRLDWTAARRQSRSSAQPGRSATPTSSVTWSAWPARSRHAPAPVRSSSARRWSGTCTSAGASCAHPSICRPTGRTR
jgi:hypothetical protein